MISTVIPSTRRPSFVYPLLGNALVVSSIAAAVFASSLVFGPFALSALLIFCILVCLAYANLEGMVIAFVVVSVLVPIDVAVRVGSLPRIGPARVLFAAVAVGWFVREFVARRATGGKRLPLAGYFGFYAAAVLVSTVLSPESSRSLFGASNQLFEVLLPFFILVACFKRPGFWAQLKMSLFLTTALACVLAFFEEITHRVLYLSFYPPDELPFRGNLLRVRSFFFHPIAFGCFLALIAPFVLADLMETKRLGRKVLLSALLGAMVVSACLTVSRGPLFAIAMEIAVFVAVWCRAHWQRMVLAILVVSGLLVSSIIVYTTNDKASRFIESILNPSQISVGHVDEQSSEYYRVALFKAVVDRLDGPRWIYGFGPGTFFIVDVDSNYAGEQHVLEAADSLYLCSLLELGILGTAALILLMLAAAWVCARSLRADSGRRRLLALASLSSVLGFIFTNTTVSMLSLWPLTILFWMSPALVLALPRREQCRMSLPSNA